MTSVLSEVEVPRALRGPAPARLAAVGGVLARISRVEMDASIRATAAAHVDDALRALDAIHIATAEMLVASGRRVSTFVIYDERQAAAVQAVGLRAEAPGQASAAPSERR